MNKPIWKQKHDQNFADVLCCMIMTMLIQIILHAKAKLWVFADRFCSHFNARGFSNHSKTWIWLRSNNIHCHFLFLKSVVKTWAYLKVLRSSCFHRSCRKNFFTGKIWGLCEERFGTFCNVLQRGKKINILYDLVVVCWRSVYSFRYEWNFELPLQFFVSKCWLCKID